MIRVTVWNENKHEKELPEMQEIYPEGIHGTIAAYLKTLDGLEVTVATQDMPGCGLPDEVLNNTDVLIWWAHEQHHLVPEELVTKVCNRVLSGMGFIALHSAHYSEPFRRLMGTTCSLRCRPTDYERIWCTNLSHPIADGIPETFEVGAEEMYGEYFDIPQPDELVFTGWFLSLIHILQYPPLIFSAGPTACR